MFTVSKTVSDETLDCIIQIESGGRPTIKASTSSALGLGQFLNATWIAVVKKHRPDVMAGKTQAQILAMRTDPSFAVEMLARFTEDNQRIVGMNCSPGDLYLAHFLGAGTAKMVYAADPSAQVSTVVSPAAIDANRSIMEGKTTGQVRFWAGKRMSQSGGHGWVAKYYHPIGAITEEKGTAIPDEPEEDATVVETAAPPAPPVLLDPSATGDPEIYSIQKRLKGRHYSPGLLDGKWGSGTSGAIGGFINDRGGHIPVPASLDAFGIVRENIKSELSKAESEGWYRPVTNERAKGEVTDVAKIAPEVVPVHRNFIITLWGSIATAATGLINSISGYIGQAWNFWTNNKDNLPSDPGIMSKVWGYVTSVPSTVWILLAAGVLLFISLNSRAGAKKIIESVQTGERQ